MANLSTDVQSPHWVRIKKKLTERNTWYRKKGSDGQMAAFKGLNANGKPDKIANPGLNNGKNANPKTGCGGLNANEALQVGERRGRGRIMWLR